MLTSLCVCLWGGSCRLSLQALIDHLSEGLVAAYASLLKAPVIPVPTSELPQEEEVEGEGQGEQRGVTSSQVPLTQNRALQLLFDFRVLTNVLPRMDDTQVEGAVCTHHVHLESQSYGTLCV